MKEKAKKALSIFLSTVGFLIIIPFVVAFFLFVFAFDLILGGYRAL